MAQIDIRIDDSLKQEGETAFQITGRQPFSVTFASEKSLAKDWLLPEEDAAWRDL
jgi:hypothetical protein